MFLGTGSLLCKVIVKNIEFVKFFILLRIIDKIGLIDRIDLSVGPRSQASLPCFRSGPEPAGA